MSSPADLAELLQRTANRDRSAFGQVYQRTHSKLFGVTLRICGDRGLAEEALQDCFVDVWRRADRYDASIASPIAWLATIARNRAIDIKRRRAEQVAAASVPHDEETASDAPDPFAHTQHNDELRRLTDCLRGLPADRQKMVLMAYYEGHSREDLSVVFARPVATVKTILRRSLALLKDCLDGNG